MSRSVSIYCPHCHRHTALSAAQVRFELGNSRYFADAKTTIQGVTWWIGACNGCGLPCLVAEEGQTIFPTPMPNATDPNIPQDIADDLNEAKKCLYMACYRACAVMARRCVQVTCLKKGASDAKNLKQQIAELEQNRVITKDVKDWADEVRWIGNDAAHEMESSMLTRK